MERIAAQGISASLEAAMTHLAKSLSYAESGLSLSEFEAFKKRIGITIGQLSYELLDPIYKEYPDLAPPGLL